MGLKICILYHKLVGCIILLNKTLEQTTITLILQKKKIGVIMILLRSETSGKILSLMIKTSKTTLNLFFTFENIYINFFWGWTCSTACISHVCGAQSTTCGSQLSPSVV